MAKSLVEAHRETAERLDEQVAEAVAAPPRPDGRRLIDRRELRGWPAAGRGICGAIGGSSPGSDEHLERLDE